MPYLLLCVICAATLVFLVRVRTAIAAAHVTSFWLDQPGPDRRPPLDGLEEADLVVVGGGLTGLWGALQAAEEGKRVVLLEGERLAFGASGRNGGFCSASLTHGIGNGLARWPDELAQLERMGRENLAGIRAAIERHGIDCGWRERGEIAVATAEHQLPWLEEEAELLRAARLGRRAARRAGDARPGELADVTSAGCGPATSRALVDPARLCWGLARAAEAAGARICEGTPVTALARDGAGVRAETPGGRVLARGALLATSAFPPLVRAIRRYVVPVYDYVLVTEPLSAEQRAAIGWRGRQGLADVTNLFHYFRHDRRTAGSSGAATTRSTTSPAGSRPSATSARRRSTCSPSTSSRPSRSSRGSASRTAGAARSTRAAASRRCGAARSAAARSTSSGSPASASARAASAPASRSTCSTAPTRERTRLEMVRRAAAAVPAGAGALGGHPAHAAGARARRRARGPARPVAARCSTGSGSGSTPERIGCRPS